MQYGPDPGAIYPNEAIKNVCFIKNTITRPNILVGDYTYYSGIHGPEYFEEHVTHHYEFLGDRLIIGKSYAIAKGIEFVMNDASHRMCSITTYPFNIMGSGREKSMPSLDDLPFKGDTTVGNDVWIGQNVTMIPGVYINDDTIIAANSVVAKDIPAYCIAGGNPYEIIRKRFGDDLTEYLLQLQWRNWPAGKIFKHLDILCSADLEKIRTIEGQWTDGKYTKAESTEAHRTISSIIHKREKVREKFSNDTFHHTLPKNRRKEVYMSKVLIEEALGIKE